MDRHPERVLRRDDAGKSWLTTLALMLSLALVIARAMQLETLRDPFEVQLHGESIARGAGAATSVVLDLFCCLPALLILARRLVHRAFSTRTSIAHWILFALAIWTAASACWSSDKFAAAVSASHFVSAAVLMWSMTQLVREWARIRLIAGVCFGLLLVYVAHGTIYRFVDLPAMRESVNENWQQILQQRGWEEGSFPAVQFKKKVMSGELIGFGTSPNTYAAMLVVLGLISAGLALQRRYDRDESGWWIAILLALLPTMMLVWMTRSRAALVTPVLGVALFSLCWYARVPLHAWRKPFYFISVAGVAIVAAAIVAHGVYHGTLFHDSLTFRWRYWVGAFRILREHPLLGIGFDNFAASYLGVRLPIASEEVRDPHNFIVRFFVETGLVGGMLLLAWLARVWWEITSPSHAQPADPRRPASALRTIVPLVAMATAMNILCSVDLAQTGSFVFIEVMKRALFAGLLIVAIVAGSIRSTRIPQFDDRPALLLRLSMIVAIAVFFVHNLIDFSMFETGPLFVLMMLIGAVLGFQSPEALPVSRMNSVVALACAVLLWLGAAVGFVAPVVAAESIASRADDALRAGRPADAANRLREAFGVLWIPNADYPRRAARAEMYAGGPSDRVVELLDAAVAHDPMGIAALRLRANYLLSRRDADAPAIIRDFERLMQLNPNDVEARITFARALARFGQPSRAAVELQRALSYNDQLSPDEPKRLGASQVQQLERDIEEFSGKRP